MPSHQIGTPRFFPTNMMQRHTLRRPRFSALILARAFVGSSSDIGSNWRVTLRNRYRLCVILSKVGNDAIAIEGKMKSVRKSSSEVFLFMDSYVPIYTVLANDFLSSLVPLTLDATT